MKDRTVIETWNAPYGNRYGMQLGTKMEIAAYVEPEKEKRLVVNPDAVWDELPSIEDWNHRALVVNGKVIARMVYDRQYLLAGTSAWLDNEKEDRENVETAVAHALAEIGEHGFGYEYVKPQYASYLVTYSDNPGDATGGANSRGWLKNAVTYKAELLTRWAYSHIYGVQEDGRLVEIAE